MTDLVILEHEIPDVWPSGMESELRRLDDICEDNTEERLDLQEYPFITIDGADAQDFDDAVYAEPNRGEWRLWVAIADVSYYVSASSIIDQVANERGNSVYFPDRVVPMLPAILSNDLCSLKQGEKRFVIVCEIEIKTDGSIRNWRFHQATICSHSRLTYDTVARYMSTGDTGVLDGVSRQARRNIDNLVAVWQSLCVSRNGRGSIDFDFPEVRMEYNHKGQIENVCAIQRSNAQRLIEECMLIANVCAAKELEAGSKQALYRIHEAPTLDNIGNLRRFMSGLGLTLGKGRLPTAEDYSGALVMAREKGLPIDVLQSMMLRSMKQAVYSSIKGPHFALGYQTYTHFTSPIRRYPDLVVHRLLKQRFGWGAGQKKWQVENQKDLTQVADHCSDTDRRAESAVRKVEQYLKAEFMQGKVGQRLSGIVSGVTEFGVFVQLSDYLIDGLVHVSNLGEEYFEFDPDCQELIGKATGSKIRLGDRMEVTVVRVDLDRGQVDFLMGNHETMSQRRRKHKVKNRRVHLRGEAQ